MARKNLRLEKQTEDRKKSEMDKSLVTEFHLN